MSEQPRVIFDEQSPELRRSVRESEASRMQSFLLKYSGGLVTSGKQATFLLVFFSLIALALSALLLLGMREGVPPPPPPDNELVRI
jgi:hypothetical protein